MELPLAALQVASPFSGAGLSLMATTDLAFPARWKPVTDEVQSAGADFSVTLPLDWISGRFHRLESN